MTADQIVQLWPVIVGLIAFVAAWAVTRAKTKQHSDVIDKVVEQVADLITRQAVMEAQLNGLQANINDKLDRVDRQIGKIFEILDKRHDR